MTVEGRKKMRNYRYIKALLSDMLLLSAALLMVAPASAGPAEGGFLYNDYCLVCHGELGGGEVMGKSLVDQQSRNLTDEQLLDVIRNGRPGTGMAAYRNSFNEEEITDLGHYVRVLQGGTGLADDSVADLADADPMVSLGRMVFEERAGCIGCHTYQDRGGRVGPALDGLFRRMDAEDVQMRLVFPDDYIAEGYEVRELVTHDGELIRGLYRNETDDHIQILSEDGRRWTTYFKRDLASIEFADDSLMPRVYPGLASNEQQALIIFLRSL